MLYSKLFNIGNTKASPTRAVEQYLPKKVAYMVLGALPPKLKNFMRESWSLNHKAVRARFDSVNFRYVKSCQYAEIIKKGAEGYVAGGVDYTAW